MRLGASSRTGGPGSRPRWSRLLLGLLLALDLLALGLSVARGLEQARCERQAVASGIWKHCGLDTHWSKDLVPLESYPR